MAGGKYYANYNEESRRYSQINHSFVPNTMPKERVFDQKIQIDELALDQSLRPKRFDEFVGQDRIKKNLSVYIEAAKKRGEAVDHILFSGPAGLGKTTLSQIIAHEMGVEIQITQGPALDKKGDLAGVLTNLKEGDILFIDEIHRLRSDLEECLYSAMEDYAFDVMIGEGPNARSLRMNLPRFTLIGATTREGLLSKPFRARFGVLEKLDYYPWEHLLKIITRSANILGVSIEDAAAEVLARRARGTPRIANRFLRRIRDLAQIKSNNKINSAIAEEGLGMMGVDSNGLEELDRRILQAVLDQRGTPVGLKTLAVTVGETEDTVEDVYEPYLIQQGYLLKTPKGRLGTVKAYEAFGLKAPESGGKSLFD